ncbi:hypothetical protein TNCV_2170441 [Trichonephila clavipes]|nr:hypothetical protein TNCV_2170441 [Trichonephila clavipes]
MIYFPDRNNDTDIANSAGAFPYILFNACRRAAHFILLAFRDVLRHGPTGPGPRPRASRLHWGPRLVLDSALIRLATCDDHRPCKGLSPYTLITHSMKRRQSVEPVCAIVETAFVGPGLTFALCQVPQGSLALLDGM